MIALATACHSCSILMNSPNPTTSPLACISCTSAEASSTAPEYGWYPVVLATPKSSSANNCASVGLPQGLDHRQTWLVVRAV